MSNDVNQNKNEDEEVYVLTPKACAYCALSDAGFIDKSNIVNETVEMKLFWSVFENLMRRSGYIHD